MSFHSFYGFSNHLLSFIEQWFLFVLFMCASERCKEHFRLNLNLFRRYAVCFSSASNLFKLELCAKTHLKWFCPWLKLPKKKNVCQIYFKIRHSFNLNIEVAHTEMHRKCLLFCCHDICAQCAYACEALCRKSQ